MFILIILMSIYFLPHSQVRGSELSCQKQNVESELSQSSEELKCITKCQQFFSENPHLQDKARDCSKKDAGPTANEMLECTTKVSLVAGVSAATAAVATIPLVGPTMMGGAALYFFSSGLNQGIETDRKCFYDIERKRSFLNLYNDSVLEEFKLKHQLKLTDDQLKNYPCIELRNLINAKQKSYHEVLGKAYYGNQNSRDKSSLPPVGSSTQGLLERFQIQTECLSEKHQREVYCLLAEATVGLGSAGLAVKKLSAYSIRNQLTPEQSILKQKSEALVNRPLTNDEVRAIEKAHLIGSGKKGKNGSFASVDNYTEAQIAQKARILKENTSLNNEERRLLFENRIVGEAAQPVELKSILQNPKPGSVSNAGLPLNKEVTIRTENSGILSYMSNSKHTLKGEGNRPNAGIEPANSLHLFIKSTKEIENHRYAVDPKSGHIHRYCKDKGYITITWHWCGSTDQTKAEAVLDFEHVVPNEVRKMTHCKHKHQFVECKPSQLGH